MIWYYHVVILLIISIYFYDHGCSCRLGITL
ncbi:hypothetical protein MPL1032_100244 [Mesorhizobium plurifarium]|uniref:Uncharacterized protein n=1 Tax=Mesorhizobium plurifarium TaxID=69974 RepID=A0A0K2VPG8_MESPL|nr:hypothetical protein MPL1032_100244 [Mesorhizobium plurifarium]